MKLIAVCNIKHKLCKLVHWLQLKYSQKKVTDYLIHNINYISYNRNIVSMKTILKMFRSINKDSKSLIFNIALLYLNQFKSTTNNYDNHANLQYWK